MPSSKEKLQIAGCVHSTQGVDQVRDVAPRGEPAPGLAGTGKPRPAQLALDQGTDALGLALQEGAIRRPVGGVESLGQQAERCLEGVGQVAQGVAGALQAPAEQPQ